MNGKKNAARVAVQAEPCLKQPIQSDGYSRAQLLLILENITTDLAALKEVLGLAQRSDDAWARACLVDAGYSMAQAIGCVADDATGGLVIGGIGHWHCGPSFSDAGGAA